jgi:uncharacterized protein YxjI
MNLCKVLCLKTWRLESLLKTEQLVSEPSPPYPQNSEGLGLNPTRKIFSHNWLLLSGNSMNQPTYLLEASDFIMKKKILSLREHYDFEDLTGTKIGEADGNLFQVPAKFNVIDTHGLEMMHLEGKVLSLRKQFTFYGTSGEELGTIKKKIVKLIGEEFWVEKDGIEFMRIYGNFTEHDYQMEVNGVQVASIHKKWVTVRDTLEVSVTGNVDHRVIIGAVIVIEHVEVTEKNSSNSGNNRFGFPQY